MCLYLYVPKKIYFYFEVIMTWSDLKTTRDNLRLIYVHHYKTTLQKKPSGVSCLNQRSWGLKKKEIHLSKSWKAVKLNERKRAELTLK